MSEKPMFFYAGVYDDLAGAQADARNLGDTLESGAAALVVVGVEEDAERVERAARRATRHVTREVQGNHEDAAREAAEVMTASA